MRRSAGWIGTPDSDGVFVHIHPARGASRHRRAVVIVPGLGEDYFHGYRALRLLADTLAEVGFTCVRMDFSGCGNSIDTRDEEAVSAWSGNVARVSSWLRTTQRLTNLCFLANRAGALFLDQAMQPADDLVLWGASVSGKGWVREQQALQRLGGAKSTHDGLESGGLWLGPRTCERMSARAFGLLADPRNVLVVDRSDRSLPAEVLDSLRQRSRHVDVRSDPDYASCFREPHHAQMPSRVCRMVAEWLAEVSDPATETTDLERLPEMELAGFRTEITVNEVTESAVEIDGLFGILTRPPQGDRIVLLGNAGSVHAVGPNRLNVELARSLAGNGIATLRYDLSNLGDSVQASAFSSPAIPDENHPYPATAEQDVDRVVQWARQNGYVHVILAGLCSGAYAAFDFARTHPAAHPDEVLLINPLTFDWRPGMSLEIPAEFRTVAQGQHYQRAVRDRSRWWRLFTGRVEYLRLFRHVVASMTERIRMAAVQAGTALHLLPQPPIANDLMRIAATGTRLRFYFSSNEPGVEMLERAGRYCLDALQRLRLISVNFIDQADHTFRRREQRRQLVEAITRNLSNEPTV